MSKQNNVRRGSVLKPGRWYRITQIDPSDPEPSLKVGDVIRCSGDPGVRELSHEWYPDFGGCWFADLDGPTCEGFGTLITGLEEVEAPSELHVFKTDVDWWVASSVEDVKALMLWHWGDPETVNEAVEDGVLQLPDEAIIKIVCDEHGEISDSGESVPRTAAEWAAREGRGLLASTEY